jgi:hypothetical protein
MRRPALNYSNLKKKESMKKEIKIVLVGSVIFFLIIASIKPKIDYYLREGDVITIRINMEKVAHALESFGSESTGKYPEFIKERTVETNEPFAAFLLKEDWYEPPIFPLGRDWYKPIKERSFSVKRKWCEPIRKKLFHKVIKFKPLTDSIPEKIYPCRIYIYTDGVRYKIIGGDKEGFLIPEDGTEKTEPSKPKIIYSQNYWDKE